MPVTINGDGSITGLAVGGLPNGTVDADSLASNAVTNAKLANGAVTQAKKTYATGEIIQVQTFKGSNGDVNCAANQDVILDTYSFTTLRANSRLLLHYHSGQIQRSHLTSNGWIWTSVDGTNKWDNMSIYIDHNHYFYDHQCGNQSDARAFNVGFDLSNQLSLGTHTIRVGGHAYGHSMVFHYQATSSVGRRSTLIAMEIAA